MPGRHSKHTPERYTEALIAFKQAGGANFLDVARRTGMDRASLKRLWDEGWPKEGFPPISQTYMDPAYIAAPSEDVSSIVNDERQLPQEGQPIVNDERQLDEIVGDERQLPDNQRQTEGTPEAGARGECAGTDLAGPPGEVARQPTPTSLAPTSGPTVYRGLTVKQAKARENEEGLVLQLQNNLIGISNIATKVIGNALARLDALLEESKGVPMQTDIHQIGLITKDLKEYAKLTLDNTTQLTKLMEASRINTGEANQTKAPTGGGGGGPAMKAAPVADTIAAMLELGKVALNIRRGQRVAGYMHDVEPASESPQGPPSLAELGDEDPTEG